MLDAIPTLPVLAAFTVASIILTITPGPDMTLFLGRTLANGRAAGIATMLGTMTGCLIHTVLAALGISALLATSPTGFLILKIVGAVYLLWLAFQAIFRGSTFQLNAPEKTNSLWRDYLMGIGVNILNPKIIIFFITFLPQFIVVGDPAAWKKMIFLGIYFDVVSLPFLIAMIFAAHRFAVVMKKNPTITRIIDYLFGTIFAAFAIKILFTEGK